MTNPDNAVGTNGAFGGRTSVNAFNDDLAVYSRGIMSGWACSPNSGLTVSLGGDGSTRDVAVAEDNAGNKTTINNISGSPVDVTLSAAPGANSRIDAIVAYVDNPPQGSDTIADNYEACGLIAVDGTPSASPTAPDDNDIRSAITADGASGATAYYVVLATVTVENGTTDIVAGDIVAGTNAFINTNNIDFTTYTLSSDYTNFLPRETAITNYSYTVTGAYKLALVVIYIDANANTYKVGVNSAANIGYSSANVRATFSFIVGSGDIINVARASGSASDPWHLGYIRKIF